MIFLQKREEVAVDIDDVLVEFTPDLITKYNRDHGTSFQIQDVTSYNFWEVFGVEKNYMVEYIQRYAHAGHLRTLCLRDGAWEAIDRLRRAHWLHAVTARNETVMFEDTVWLLSQCFPGAFVNLHFASHHTEQHRSKGDICKALGVKAIIDDSLHNAKECADLEWGAYLVNQPWNQNPVSPSIRRVPSIIEAVDHLLF